MPLTDSTTTTRRLVETFFRRLSERDPDAVAELFSDDVDWYIPGNQELASWLGRRSSRKDVAEFFRLLWENAEPITAHLDHVLVDENVAIVTGSFSSRMRRTGKTFESIFSADFTVRDGAIVRYRLLEDSHGLVRSLTA